MAPSTVHSGELLRGGANESNAGSHSEKNRAARSFEKEPMLFDEPEAEERSLESSSWSRNLVSVIGLDAAILATFIRTLLLPAYRSTDFEVHRNWLAITYSRSLSQWYRDATSQWTLDYPPFFAFFSYLLSLPAYLVDPAILSVQAEPYEAPTAIAYLRTTVTVAEVLTLWTALARYASPSSTEVGTSGTRADPSTLRLVALSIIFHPGLLIVDHIHFQYNGFLLGVLVWTFVLARKAVTSTGSASDTAFLLLATAFASLLNLKHIFVYLAPPYFIFLLRNHCFTSEKVGLARKEGESKAGTGPPTFVPQNFINLALVVLAVFGASFAPFFVASAFSSTPASSTILGDGATTGAGISAGISGIMQIFRRLFPFQRGLNHAYWAPNVWALVTAVDRVLVKYLVKRGWPISPEALNSASRGLVGDTTFGVVPDVTPDLCFGITLALSLVYMTKLWLAPSYRNFLTSVTLSAFTSFLFGWHVHEKAVLLFLVPLSLLAVEHVSLYRIYVLATSAGVVALFPLLIGAAETPVKILYSAIWAALVFPALGRVVHRPPPSTIRIIVDFFENFYLVGLIFLQVYVSLVHPILFSTSSQPITSPEVLSDHSPPPEPPTPTFGQSDESHLLASIAVVSEQVSAAAEMIYEAAGGGVTGGGIRGKEKGGSTLEFLPLMLTSVYCAVGVIWTWLRLSALYLVKF